MTHHRYRLDTRILSVFFLVAMPFVAFGAFVVIGMARGALTEQVGTNLEQRAFQTRVAVERYVGDLFVQLRLLAHYPELRLPLAAPAKPVTPEEATRLSEGWATGDKALNDALVGSPAAARLRDVVRLRPAIRLLQVIDSQGRLVASSSRGGRILNADTVWFKAMTTDPILEKPWLGEIYQPQGSSLAVYDLAWPVLDAEGVFLGALRVVADAGDLYGVLAAVRVGRSGHAELIRASDGLVLVSDDSARVLKSIAPGFSYVRAAMAERRGYWLVPEVTEKAPDGSERATEQARLVGYSPVEQLPNAQWLVTVEQDTEEALAPVARITRYLWLHFLGAFGTAILLGLYFSYKLEKPVIEERIHLHEEHVPKGARVADPEE
jgi:hypothetical protein